MAYNEFTLDMLLRNFPIQLEEVPNLFAEFEPIALSALLQQQLDEYLTLALEISTEKARSEFIIAPILGEIRRHFQKRISLFSGVEFNRSGKRVIFLTLVQINGSLYPRRGREQTEGNSIRTAAISRSRSDLVRTHCRTSPLHR